MRKALILVSFLCAAVVSAIDVQILQPNRCTDYEELVDGQCVCSICPIACPRKTTWSNDDCDCVRCPNRRDCPNEGCQSACPNECTQYERQNPFTCECVCYICPLECLAGTSWSNDACDCVACQDADNCPNRGCGPDPCPEQDCGEYAKWNDLTCSCDCILCPTSCPAGTTWIDSACNCVPCTDVLNCPNRGCGPEPCPEQDCGEFGEWDFETCACRCTQCPATCPAGTTWVDQRCNCVPCTDLATCPNRGCSDCVEQKCTPYQVWDPETCSCRNETCPTACQLGSSWSNDAWDCVPCFD